MPTTHNVSSPIDQHTLTYLAKLDEQSSRVVRLVDSLPMPAPLRRELQQTWRITRQKLAYFRREFYRADGELQEDLRILHAALLPEVIAYQVKLGAMMISDTCDDRCYLGEWKEIWKNYDIS